MGANAKARPLCVLEDTIEAYVTYRKQNFHNITLKNLSLPIFIKK